MYNGTERQIEKDYVEGKHRNMDEALIKWSYVDVQYINCDYDGDMTISKAYEYLKMLPTFEGVEDI